MKKDIRAYEYDELKNEIQALGEKAFRTGQIYDWLHVKLADDFDDMTNVSKNLKERLVQEYEILPVRSARSQNWTVRISSFSACTTETWWKACSCVTDMEILCASLHRRGAGWGAYSVRPPSEG